ncbi:MAG: hypothetical protein ACI9NT_002160 [Bacteroidia bacterium]
MALRATKLCLIELLGEKYMSAAKPETSPTPIRANLGFVRPDQVVEDFDNRGLKRAITRPIDSVFESQFEYRECELNDWSAAGRESLDLPSMGFEAIDLSPHSELQELLATCRAASEITPDQARRLRRYLTGSTFPLAGGKCLKFLNIAPEGLIMRKGGPNGLKIEQELSDTNSQDVALAIHADQDVHGTPLKQLMRGYAPRLFRHQSPDGANRLSPMVLVNLWIPLQQITRPLTLMDRRTLKAREQQLRYALPTESFLDRSEDMRFNDIWTVLHDEQQAWYFSSEMSHDQAYVFDTLGEPHGATLLPGEATAEYYYLLLEKQVEQMHTDEPVAVPIDVLAGDPPPLPDVTTSALREAVTCMAALTASVPSGEASQEEQQSWLDAAETALETMVRKSIEMRVVALLLPNRWPFNRGMTQSH